MRRCVLGVGGVERVDAALIAATAALPVPAVTAPTLPPALNPFDALHAANVAEHQAAHAEATAALAAHAEALAAAGVTATQALDAMNTANSTRLSTLNLRGNRHQ